MPTLRKDLPDLADLILQKAREDGPLREALEDYEQACASLDDLSLSAETRSDWTQIHRELVFELERRARRLSANLRKQRTIP